MNIKKFIFGILLFTVFMGFAQRNDNDKIKAYKTAFITDALELTSDEAEKFWPVYNAYEKEYQKIKIAKTRQIFRKIRAAGGVDKLSNAEADTILEEFLEIDVKVAEAKEKLKKDLTGVISAKKMIKLISAEQNFNKELLKRFRNRAGNPERN
ncbi:sensor of ECF-type sigma factor [Aureibaculum sp. 2210JD6-5]|uniref:sensor of ECF-type sigma factor n=1 Tax=Aureibaculum sp. 2210JD6-5 TaxID=3103957 RepID=UPI002AAE0DD5|nr:sensor of ECF-type sigma factor [Aureibaculum sp. 2210JD6-5]MDY7395423.1 sensor of ECF-type sigma factor [Aureibaculum sp. 2210JD6-5]